jgi:hypothetical protein
MGFDFNQPPAQITPESLERLREAVALEFRGYFYQPIRMEWDGKLGLMASPWTYHDSFGQDGIRFEIWFHWDGRARLEQCLPDGDRVPILLFRQGAADLFKAMETRRQARAGLPAGT